MNYSHLNWEQIELYRYEESPGNYNRVELAITERAKVYGGWLVRTRSQLNSSDYIFDGQGVGVGHSSGRGVGLTFVPDPDYLWSVP